MKNQNTIQKSYRIIELGKKIQELSIALSVINAPAKAFAALRKMEAEFATLTR